MAQTQHSKKILPRTKKLVLSVNPVAINPQTPDPVAAAKQLQSASTLRPTLAIVLGSAFGTVANTLDVDCKIPFEKIIGFTKTTVQGHAGAVLFGHLAGVPVLMLSGRAHFYEGYSMQTVTFPIRVLGAFGIKCLLLTNAAGGINRKFRPGDFMLVRDHINFMGENPLRGCCDPGLTPFVDLTTAYDPELNNYLKKAARTAHLTLWSGVYVAVPGPSYETPAEIRAFAKLGADAIGMSTVPEVIVARQCGIRVAAVSCITNLAAGRSKKPLAHHEVLKIAERIRPAASALLKNFVRFYAG